ncbi:PRTRC system protein C [Cupriavidus basilensis]|uniref:PRTRC system protein C n=1 Tax=Cupriavidus basilensis TaxID=68895 RepID=A0ABT6AGH5_9BURK|nr:PRTRC system protein C [Cupriavidus basilensis]MDF3831432.1 PRTRC system protein C [Cupriavidus basilensis]
MSIAITEIRRTFRYNGIQLPDVPGLGPREVRDLYSAQYPELISAEIEAGEVRDGEQEFTFLKAVGVKGGGSPRKGERLAALSARMQAECEGVCGTDPKLTRQLERPSVKACSEAWSAFAQRSLHYHQQQRADVRVCATSDMLVPLP